MQKLDVSWSAAHRHVRTGKVFIAVGGGARGEEQYVKHQTSYKIAKGDIFCIDDKLLAEHKANKKSSDQKRKRKQEPIVAAVGRVSEFEDMIVFENDHLIVIDKPCGYPC